MKKRNLNLPVNYSLVNFDSERFLKMRVRVMHSGLNLNNSHFGAETIEKAKPTLANIPILAFVKKTDGKDDSDFAGHEFEIKITENDMKYVYLGRPIGIIPETNNYEIVEDDGEDFVVVDGYIWKDYANEALDIIQRDEVKKVSMEIIVNDYEWEESYVKIKDYAYTGIAMLGEGVREAMIGAKAELINYSSVQMSEVMRDMKKALEEGGTFMSVNTEEKDLTLEDEKDKDLEVNEEFEAENVKEVEGAESLEEESLEEEFVESKGSEEENTDDENLDEEFTEEGGSKNEVEDEKPEGEFSITEEEVIELKNTIDSLNAENESLKETNAELMNFKEETIKEKKDELVAKFNDLEESDLEELKEKMSDFSLEDLETKLYALRGKKLDFSKNQQANKLDKLVFALSNSTEKNSQGPEWVDLVEANINKKGGE